MNDEPSPRSAAARAARAGPAPGHRRLRHRLHPARLPARLPGRPAQDRPLVHEAACRSDPNDAHRRPSSSSAATCCGSSPRASRRPSSSTTIQTAGCDTAQGFLFYRPEPPDVVEQLLADTHAAAAAERAEAESSPAGISGGAGPIDGIDRASPASVSRAPRRLMPPPGAPGSRRRLARSSLVAGIKAMTHTWLNSA